MEDITMVDVQLRTESPFGISFYDTFGRLYTAVTGKSLADFAFAEGVTPLSTPRAVGLSCILYYTFIFGGRHLMQTIPPFKLKRISQLHNVLLTITSASLLILILEQVVPQLVDHGLYFAICSKEGWTQKLELLYYLNYLVKYWELADTVLLVLKKKKLEFLHYFHHSMTMVLCYTQLVGQTTVSWVPIVLNLTVHVFMYYYYFCTTSGVKVWWKQHLTTLQIIQFVIDVFVIYGCTYSYYANRYVPRLPNFGTCAGTKGAAWFGCTLLSSYLVLFIHFYHNTYPSTESKAATKERMLKEE